MSGITVENTPRYKWGQERFDTWQEARAAELFAEMDGWRYRFVTAEGASGKRKQSTISQDERSITRFLRWYCAERAATEAIEKEAKTTDSEVEPDPVEQHAAALSGT